MVDSALNDAHAIITSPVYQHKFPDGEVNDDYPINDGGWWGKFTESLERRHELKGKEQTADPGTLTVYE